MDPLVQDVDNGAGYACVRAGSVWEIPVPSSQLCCELKLLLKKKSFVFCFFSLQRRERLSLEGERLGWMGKGLFCHLAIFALTQAFLMMPLLRSSSLTLYLLAKVPLNPQT